MDCGARTVSQGQRRRQLCCRYWETQDQNESFNICIRTGVYLERKPWNVPTRYTSDIFYNNLEVGELDHSHCVEGHIEKDERPFEEGVDGVGCRPLALTADTEGRAHLQGCGAPCAG
jgi:hypothetical protein